MNLSNIKTYLQVKGAVLILARTTFWLGVWCLLVLKGALTSVIYQNAQNNFLYQELKSFSAQEMLMSISLSVYDNKHF